MRPAPQTPPLLLGPAHCLVLGTQSRPLLAPSTGSTALTRVKGLLSSPVPFWGVPSYTQHPLPFTSRTLSSSNQSRGPREKTLIPQG